jgi:hypothetical protein
LCGPKFCGEPRAGEIQYSMRDKRMRFNPHIAVLTALIICGAVFHLQSQSTDEGDALFQRVKAHLAAHLSQLPKYTCHQTIDRTIRVGSNFRHMDTVELDVAFADNRQELFSKTGENRFDDKPISQLVSGGTISKSALGSHVDIIFADNLAEFKYVGQCKKDGRKTVRFDLHVPIERSTFRVIHNGRAGMAGFDGSVWVDAETLDLVRVDFKVNRIPSYLGVRLIEESLHYRKMTIGNAEFDLPHHSELAATDDMGTYSLNLIKLSGCREFGADSVVKFGEPVQGTANRDRQDQ